MISSAQYCPAWQLLGCESGKWPQCVTPLPVELLPPAPLLAPPLPLLAPPVPLFEPPSSSLPQPATPNPTTRAPAISRVLANIVAPMVVPRSAAEQRASLAIPASSIEVQRPVNTPQGDRLRMRCRVESQKYLGQLLRVRAARHDERPSNSAGL